jgi:serine/threonine protein kinase
LSPGTILHGQYQIAKLLGHGGFGITYLAWDNLLEIKLAIKEYMPRDFATRNSTNSEISAFAGDAQANFSYGLERFLEEARTLAKFQQHNGIVSVLNVFYGNGTGYMVMEYVDGLTLKEYLIQKDKLTWEQTLKLFMPVMDALREVHKYGMLHRDISPDNIYLCRDNRVKLLDFGSARYSLGGHSRSLSVVVKPGYAPEEQYRTKGNQGPWTDVYSVAASMYRCITGLVPPDALDRLDEDELRTPSKLGINIPDKAERELMAALAIKSNQRTQSIDDLQKGLLGNVSNVNSSNLEKKFKDSPKAVYHSNINSKYFISILFWGGLFFLGIRYFFANEVIYVPHTYSSPVIDASELGSRQKKEYPPTLDNPSISEKPNQPLSSSIPSANPYSTEPSHQEVIPSANPAPNTLPSDLYPENIEKNNIQNSSGDAKLLLLKILDYSLDNGGVNNESEISEIKKNIESLPKPINKLSKEAREKDERGVALSNAGDLEAAAKLFEDAHNLNKGNVEYLNNMAFIYLKQGKVELAERTIIETLSIMPTRAIAWGTLGDVFAVKGDLAHSIASFSNDFRFSNNKIRTYRLLNTWNENEDNYVLKQARNEVLNWAEKTYPELHLTQVKNDNLKNECKIKSVSNIDSYVIEKLKSEIVNHSIRIRASLYCDGIQFKDGNTLNIATYTLEGACYDSVQEKPGTCSIVWDRYMIGFANEMILGPIKIGGKGDFLDDTVKFSGSNIEISGLIYGPDDAMCCPTVPHVKKFILSQKKFIESLQ